MVTAVPNGLRVRTVRSLLCETDAIDAALVLVDRCKRNISALLCEHADELNFLYPVCPCLVFLSSFFLVLFYQLCIGHW